jgi:oligopeptide transport system substrate-binding protein
MNKFIIALLSVIVVCSCGGGEKHEIPKVKEAKGGINIGGVFRLNEVEEFKNLYPHNLTEVTSHRIGNQVYEGLVKFDQETLEVIPSLAETWEINDDATEFIFNLRRGVKFHDDACFEGGKGRELTAHDFKYVFTKLCESSAQNQMFWLFKDRVKGASEYHQSTITGKPLEQGVTGVQVVNDYTLKIELEYPFAGFLKILAHSGCWVFPKEAVEKYDLDMRTHTVGTGPFKVKTVKEGEVVVLAKNSNYWKEDQFGNQLPYLDVVKVSFIKEKKAELMEFNKGNLDMVFQLPVEEIQNVMGSLDDAKSGSNVPFELQSKSALNVQYYAFLNTHEIFKNVAVRKAFNHAIDRESIVNFSLQGLGISATNGFVPPSFVDYPHEQVKGYEYNPDLARKYMEEAGYKNGKGFPKITLQLNSGGKTNENVAEAIQKMLEEVLNIEIELSIMPFSQHIERFQTGQSEFWRVGWIADYPDPENFLNFFLSKHIPANDNESAFMNSMRYRNEEFDKTMEMAFREINNAARNELYMKADQILMDDAAVMPIYYDENIRLVNKKIKNFPINAMEYRDFSEVYFELDEKK